MKNNLVSGLGAIVLGSFIAFNSQNVIADSGVNEIYISGISIHKNQLTESEKTIIDYIEDLKNNGLPDDFKIDYSVCYPIVASFFSGKNSCLAPNFETSSHYFRDCLSSLTDQTEEEITKKYTNNYNRCPLFSVKDEKKNLSSLIGIAYKTIDDKKPEMGLIGVIRFREDGQEEFFILYDKKQDEKDKFVKTIFKHDSENKSEAIEKIIVSEDDLKEYYGILKILRSITYNQGYLENIPNKLKMKLEAEKERKLNEDYLRGSGENQNEE